MAKGQSPLLGYNTNVRHKGRVYHIQTEDSGVQHPHVITHLFADGGRILKSNKTSYAELLEAADLQVQVKKIMQDQHKAMFIALRDGQFDHLIDPDSTQTTPAITSGAQTIPNSAPQSPAAASVAAQPPEAAPAPKPAGPPRPPPIPAAVARTPASPPASSARPPSTGASSPGDTGKTGTLAPGSQPPSANRSGRYAPVRAPEILGSFKPKPESTSIFGDSLMSEKSLDEVILAYLADDLEEKKS